jgi:hypothetical protein
VTKVVDINLTVHCIPNGPHNNHTGKTEINRGDRRILHHGQDFEGANRVRAYNFEKL